MTYDNAWPTSIVNTYKMDITTAIAMNIRPIDTDRSTYEDRKMITLTQSC